MKSRLIFNVRQPWEASLDGILHESGMNRGDVEAQVESLCVVFVASIDPRIDMLKAALIRRNIEWDEQFRAEYSKEELDGAALLIVHIRTAPRGDSGVCCGTAYDFADACPACGCGAAQVGPLQTKRVPPVKPSKIMSTLSSHILVSPDVAAGVPLAKGDTKTVCDSASGRPLEWVQLLPEAELPAMDRTTQGLTRWRECATCHRNGWFHTLQQPYVPTYRRSALPNLAGEARSYELFGASNAFKPKERDRSLAHPEIVVRQSTRRALLSLKVKGIEFIPVTIVE